MEYTSTETRQLPRFTISCEPEDYIVLMLAKAGWWGGNPSVISLTPVDEVLRAYYFENFTNDMKTAVTEMELKKRENKE